MKTIQILITSFVFLLLTGTISAASQPSKAIDVSLPSVIIDEAIQKSLPMDFPIDSNTILGSVSIDAIQNLQFRKEKISAHITLSGHELNLLTTIAGHKLRMKFGSLTMGFQCDATIRFDEKSQTLFLKPVITELRASDKAKTEVASAIALLFNNREFPLQIKKLRPILADTSNKLLTIAVHVKTINLHPSGLHLQLTPQISVTTKEKSGIQNK